MSKQIFWITNGVNRDDDDRVIVNTEEQIICNHCYKKTLGGFKAVGNIKYEICKNCLYRPSLELRVLNFITVSKKAHKEEFDLFLEKCINKEDYLQLLAEVK